MNIEIAETSEKWIKSKQQILDEIQLAKTGGEKKKAGKYDLLIKIGGFVGLVIGWQIGKFLGLTIFLFLIPVFLGTWLPKWYLSRFNANKTLLSILIWANVIAWLLPFVGIGFASLTLTLDKYLLGGFKKKARILGWIGLIVTLINGGLGILIRL